MFEGLSRQPRSRCCVPIVTSFSPVPVVPGLLSMVNRTLFGPLLTDDGRARGGESTLTPEGRFSGGYGNRGPVYTLVWLRYNLNTMDLNVGPSPYDVCRMEVNAGPVRAKEGRVKENLF